MDAKKTAAKRSATAMLKADRQRVRQLVAQYNALAESDSADDDRKRMLAERICQELDVHARLEEELFYPAVRELATIDEADLARRMGERRQRLEAEQSMRPFEARTSMLTMPIRAAAGTAPRKAAGTTASMAVESTARKVASAASRSAASSGRTAAGASASKGTRSATGAKAGTKATSKTGAKADSKSAADSTQRGRSAR
jgi:hypothetical protein